MDLHEIKALIEAMASSDLAEMEVAKDGWTLRLVRRRQAAAALEAPRLASPALTLDAERTGGREADPIAPSLDIIRAPLSGIVYLSASPDEPAFVEAGQRVEAGATLCVVEAMKVFNEIRTERDAVVEAVLVASGDEVEAGQPLLRLA